jgi:hypothetical protein
LRANFDLRSDSKLIWVVQSLSQKYSAFAVGQITAISSRHPIPEEGRIAIVTNAGWEAWTRQRRARQACSQGGIAVSEQQRAGRTAFVSAFAKASSDGYQARRSLLAKTGRVRQNRVVLTPVAGAKSVEASRAQPGPAKPPIRVMTVTRRIRRRGERGISRKTIAQGMPDCLR